MSRHMPAIAAVNAPLSAAATIFRIQVPAFKPFFFARF
jgi:hypothetical protein